MYIIFFFYIILVSNHLQSNTSLVISKVDIKDREDKKGQNIYINIELPISITSHCEHFGCTDIALKGYIVYEKTQKRLSNGNIEGINREIGVIKNDSAGIQKFIIIRAKTMYYY